MAMVQAIIKNPSFLEGKEFITLCGFAEGGVQAHYNAVGTLHYKTLYLDIENTVEAMEDWLHMRHPNAVINKINYIYI